ncbi:OmpA family protein [Piscinibacter sp. XHJ-5]|uniref:OmpA family protein n=1 Tax=Piscinibacter sp. XHJ-5 TaxID=3037797 RepID=UPI00245317A2|nr:OmpA family protein [Piscinibacter sp. XHJ-5]
MMPTTSTLRALRCAFFWASAALVAALCAGCAAPPAAAPSGNELPFDQAAMAATDALVAQTQKMPAFLAKVESKLLKRGLVIDPMLEGATGQQTALTQQLEKRVMERIASQHEQFEVLPFRAAGIAKAQLLLTGTLTRAQTDRPRSPLRINLALVDLKAGTVLAQSSALAADSGLDNSPLAYWRDSPILVKDKVVEGYVRTAASAAGQRADPVYFERVSTAALIDEATTLYNGERYQDSLTQYRQALSTPAGEQMRVLNGIYLNNVKLGRMTEAEQAFGKVVALGIAYNQLGVKFLFNPGGTEFWSDPKVSSAYGMWLRQIARESTAAKVCMSIVGHTSRTGSEPVNDALSLQRATYIKQRLASEAAELAGRTKAQGMGFRENIVGSGTDNVVDALDRRVEFKIVPCG